MHKGESILILILTTLLLLSRGTKQEDTKEGPVTVLIIIVPATGHMTPLLPITEELLNRGHKVIFSTLELGAKVQKDFQKFNNKTSLSNLEFFSLGGDKEEDLFKLNPESQGGSPFVMIREAFTKFQQIEEQMLPPLLARFEKEKVDVVVTDFLSFAGYSLADHYHFPVVNFVPGTLSPSWDSPLYIPPFGVPLVPSEMESFSSRLKSLGGKIISGLIYEYIRYLTNYSRSLFHIAPTEYHNHDYVTVVNSFVGFDYPAPINSGSVFYVGDVRTYSTDQLALPDDMAEWVSRSKAEIIYVAFGTVSSQTEATLKEMRKAFEALTDYRFIWSVRSHVQTDHPAVFASLPPHILLVNWAPQTELLHHPLVRLFFSHGGYNSLSEAMHAGKTVLCMPFLGDQVNNCLKAKSAGFSETVSSSSSSADILSSLRLLLTDPHYSSSARVISQKVEYAQRGGGAAKAADVIEQVAIFGPQSFYSIARDYAWYRKMSLDVLLAVVLITALIVYVTFRLLRSIFRFIFYRKSAPSAPLSKKIN